MKYKDYTAKVRETLNAVAENAKQNGKVENLAPQLSEWGCLNNPFKYGAICERNFERNLRSDYTRKTTFTADLSLAEWCAPHEGINGVIDTIRRALVGYRDNIEYFGELIIAVNMKCWEHHARRNAAWSELYSNLYYAVKDLFFDWFDEGHKDNEKAVRYYLDYID